MSRELLQELRSIADQISKLGNGDLDGNSDGNVLAQHARKLLDAELARHEWVKFTDALPIVPEGKFSVRIWAFRADKGKVFRANWWQHYGFQKINFTHWQYRQDDTPAPPEEA